VNKLIIILAILAGPVAAQTIDASGYPIGTDISNAVPGVSLSFITLSAGERPSVGELLSAISYTSVPLTIQSSTIQTGSTFSTLGIPTGGDSSQRLVLLQFAKPISAFSYVALNASGDPNNEYLFNKSGVEFAEAGSGPNTCAYNPTGNGCNYWNTGASYKSSTPIAEMMIGSFSSAGYILSIDATPTCASRHVAPEIDPSSLPAGLTLLFGALLVARGKRFRRAQ
jgi:hypothetical protein